jgi:DNA invertase Pin-like site-specific DNA recombinase
MQKNHREDELIMPRRAYPYGRESHLKSVHGDGPARQADFAAQISEEEGWYLDDTYHFADLGRSGFHGDHLGPKGHLTRFLKMVREGTITSGSVLVIENLDRLSRQEVDLAYDVFREILKAGIWIATKQPRRIYKRENTGLMDLMEPVWLFYLAHEESAKKSMRVAHAWQTRRKNTRESNAPHRGRHPGWLRRTATGYEVPPRNARTLVAIFRMLTEGLGIHRLTARLNARPEDYPCFSRTGKWNKAYLRKIVHGREVLGEYQPYTGRGKNRRPEGTPVKDHYPAVVTEEERDLALAALAGRRGKSGRPGDRETNLFTGLVFEAGTGAKMSIDGYRTPDRPYHYLLPNKDNLGSRQGRCFPYRQFEPGVRKRIGQLTARDVLPPASVSNAREQRIAELTSNLVRIGQRLETTGRELDAEDDPETRAQLRASLKRLGEEKRLVGAELEVLKLESRSGRAEALATVKSLDDLLREAEGTPEEADLRRKLKAAIQMVVESIWIKVQVINRNYFIGHVQIYLRSGVRRYVQLFPARPPQGFRPWDLSECDFRAGNVGDVADDPEAVA